MGKHYQKTRNFWVRSDRTTALRRRRIVEQHSSSLELEDTTTTTTTTTTVTLHSTTPARGLSAVSEGQTGAPQRSRDPTPSLMNTKVQSSTSLWSLLLWGAFTVCPQTPGTVAPTAKHASCTRGSDRRHGPQFRVPPIHPAFA
jgi:hypothetical protein